MSKSTKITVMFVLIFLVGVLGFVTYINRFLNTSHSEVIIESSKVILESPIKPPLEVTIKK